MTQAVDLALIPISRLQGVGPATLARLQKLDLHSVFDLLLHQPSRYEDRSRLTALSDAAAGTTVTVEGVIKDVRTVGAKRQLLVAIDDGTSRMALRFFHYAPQQSAQMKPDRAVRAYGEVTLSQYGPEIIHPDYVVRERLSDLPPLPERLTAVYPTTDGLYQSRLRSFVTTAMGMVLAAHGQPLDEQIKSLLPGSPDFREALLTLHQPLVGDDIAALADGRHPALQRLAVEELLAHQLAVLQRRKVRGQVRAARITADAKELRNTLQTQLPFEPTGAQRRVMNEIVSDLNSGRAMMRLVQGDVGSGKTVVAALACLAVQRAGFQSALMAPTELLAEQHFANLMRWLTPLNMRLALFTGRRKNQAAKRDLASGGIDLAIGTHALIQQSVEFARLGLVVVDEQHRFGVRQRLDLWRKGNADSTVAHQLVMTATPIPRTLAQTAYADLDISVIDMLPPNRKPVGTVSLPANRRDEVIARVGAACAAGRQAYWVCPLVEESDALSAEAAEQTAELLHHQLAPLRVGLVHGRMKSAAKESALNEFRSGRTQVLVATTVIEVGVDVPNASLIVIDGADRLGLAQLHQLRGRVGRGTEQSYCLLLYTPPLSSTATARLTAMRASNDGFFIAEQDLALRGPGEILGTRQTGEMRLKIADLMRDQALINVAQPLAEQLFGADDLVAALQRRWLGEGPSFAAI